MLVVRLCKRTHNKLDGVGASITGGRWNSKGNRVVYTSINAPLAILEYMVNMTHLPVDMVFLQITIPDTLDIDESHWVPPDLVTSRQIGDEWLKAPSAAPVLRVPSVIVPDQHNYLINPDHPLAKAIKVSKEQLFAFDRRLLGALGMNS